MKKFVKFFAAIFTFCFIFSSFAFANGYNPTNSDYYILGDAFSESEEVVFRISPKSRQGGPIGYVDVSLSGSGGIVYAKMWGIGNIGNHNLTIKLYSGTSNNPSFLEGYENTTSIGSVTSPTTVSASTRSTTKFWKVTVTGTMLNGTVVDYSTYVFLYNKKAVRYPTYTDYASGKTLTVPSATMPVVPTNQRVSWTSSDRANYIRWYENTYNNGNPMSWNWSNYQIHHIIPRKYGGTNAYSNLIPLPTTFHQTTVNTWWSNY